MPEKELTVLSIEEVREVCKVGLGELCCRYLVAGTAGFECAKLSSLKTTIDIRVAAGAFNAKGDNCEGK